MNLINGFPITDLMMWVVIPLLFAGAGLAFIRLIYGPSLPDRVVALELMSMAAIGIIIIYSSVTERTELLDVALVVTMIGFLGTVAFATYLSKIAN